MPETDEITLASAAHDQPPVPPKQIVLIASVPRSGTHLLGRLLLQLGYGVPLEYYQPLHRTSVTSRWDLDPEHPDYWRDYFEAIVSHRTAGGCCVITCFPQHFGLLKAGLAGRGGVGAVRCIHLWRRDSLAQAISHRLSVRSGVWDITAQPTGESRDIDLHDLDALSRTRAQLVGHQLFWRGFLARAGIDTVHIAYEDLVADRDATMRRIVAFLDPAGSGGALPAFTEPQTGERLRARQGASEAERQQLRQAYIERFGSPVLLPEPLPEP